MNNEKLDGGLSALTDVLCQCRQCLRDRGEGTHMQWGFVPTEAIRMIVCPVCGDKRCVHAIDHRAPCAKADIYGHNAWVEHYPPKNAAYWEAQARQIADERDAMRAAIQRALADSESGNGWGPDVTVCAYLQDALTYNA